MSIKRRELNLDIQTYLNPLVIKGISPSYCHNFRITLAKLDQICITVRILLYFKI